MDYYEINLTIGAALIHPLNSLQKSSSDRTCNEKELMFSAPGQHIQHLFARWESAISEKEKLQGHVSELQEKFKADLEMQVKVAVEDGDNKVKDALEKAKIEGWYKVSQIITFFIWLIMNTSENTG